LPFRDRLILLFFTILIHEYPAQELITDRPDQSESAVSVLPGSIQIETGFAFEKLTESNINVENYTIAGTLLRYGIVDDVELRLGTAYLITNAQSSIDGFGDFLLGAKINFLKENEQVIDFGILAHALLPIGSAAFNPIEVEPEIIAALSKSLNDDLSASLNFGGSWSSIIDETFLIYSAALGQALNGKTSVFIEVYGNVFSSFSPIHNFNGGIIYLLSEDLQLDLSGGKGIAGVESYWFISSGLSIRFNKI
jgi:Putative MetA-pathway of phenol degradation